MKAPLNIMHVMQKKRLLLFVAVFFSTLFIADAFNVNSLLLKVSVRTNDAAQRTITITTETGDNLVLDVDVPGVSIGEPSLNLQPGEHVIDVKFDPSGINPGVYVGVLSVAGSEDEVSIPIIFEVESRDVFFDSTITIPPQYNDIVAGGKLVTQVKIFDLFSGSGSNIVDLQYFIYDEHGDVVSAEAESISVGKETQLTKTVSFPEYMDEGTYVFAVLATYKSSISTASHLFTVSAPPAILEEPSLDKSFLLVFVSVLAFFAVLIFLFVYLIHDRDKFILALKKHHTSELEEHKHFLHMQAGVIARKKKKKGSRHAVRTNILTKEIHRKINHLKAKHKKQLQEMQKLKSLGELKQMQQKLELWKSAGYDTWGLEYRLKGISAKEMRRLLAKMRKKIRQRPHRTEEYKKEK